MRSSPAFIGAKKSGNAGAVIREREREVTCMHIGFLCILRFGQFGGWRSEEAFLFLFLFLFFLRFLFLLGIEFLNSRRMAWVESSV